MIKSIFAISNHGDFLGGGEHSFIELLSNLPDDWKPIAAIPHKGDLAKRLETRRIKTHIVPLSPLRLWSGFEVCKCIQNHYRLCIQNTPLLIYANGSRAAFYGGIIGRILKIPMVWHCRIAERDVKLDFLLARLSTYIVANSKATAKRFKPHFQNKVKMIYNGLDLKWLRSEPYQRPALIQADWKVILVVARVSRQKRHDLLISAFETVAHSDPKVHLVCIGEKDVAEPQWWDTLQVKTSKSPFSERIHWVGKVDDVRPWYRSADMLVLASEHESFGRVMVEAMACSLPVIATRRGAIPEIVRHHQDGLLVTSGKTAELVGAILKILQDDSLKDHLVRSARQRAELFSLERHVGKMLEVFEEVSKQATFRMRPSDFWHDAKTNTC